MKRHLVPPNDVIWKLYGAERENNRARGKSAGRNIYYAPLELDRRAETEFVALKSER